MSKAKKKILILGTVPLAFYSVAFYLNWKATIFTLFGALLAHGLNNLNNNAE